MFQNTVLPIFFLEKLLPKWGCGLSTETQFKLFEFEGLVAKLCPCAMLYDRQSRKSQIVQKTKYKHIL